VEENFGGFRKVENLRYALGKQARKLRRRGGGFRNGSVKNQFMLGADSAIRAARVRGGKENVNRMGADFNVN